MAASLFRAGRLASVKCLQVERWSALKNSPAAGFCTQTKEPTKPVKKIKAAAKIAEAPDDRSALLAYKTAVVFPVRLSEPGVFSVQTPGVPEAPANSSATSETSGATSPDLTSFHHVADTTPPVADVAPKALQPLLEVNSETSAPEEAGVRDVVPAATASMEPTAADESSSSSSSDSDSDSESDSEDKMLQEKTESESSSEFIAPMPLEKTKVQEPSADAEAVHEAAEAPQPTAKSPSAGSQESGESSPDSSAHTQDATKTSSSEIPANVAEYSSVSTDAQEKTPASAVTQAEPVGKTQTGVPVQEIKNSIEAPAEPAEDTQVKAAERPVEAERRPEAAERPVEAERPPEAAERPVEAERPPEAAERPVEAERPPEAAERPVETERPPEAAERPVEAERPPEAAERPVEAERPPEAAVEASISTDSTEELVDLAPVLADAAGEELQETPEQPKETAAAAPAPPEPEEPFDNSTYKNYQHHGYTAYTFVDLDVEMAKYRLPQPSSGRPSPRH